MQVQQPFCLAQIALKCVQMIEFLSFLCSGPEVYPPSTVYASKSDSSGSPVPVSVSHYNPVTSLSPAPGSPEAAPGPAHVEAMLTTLQPFNPTPLLTDNQGKQTQT